MKAIIVSAHPDNAETAAGGFVIGTRISSRRSACRATDTKKKLNKLLDKAEAAQSTRQSRSALSRIISILNDQCKSKTHDDSTGSIQ